MFLRCKLSQFFLTLTVAVVVAGCAVPVAAPALNDDLDFASLRLAIVHSLAYLKKLPPDRVVGVQPRTVTAQELLDSLIAFDGLLAHRRCWRLPSARHRRGFRNRSIERRGA